MAKMVLFTSTFCPSCKPMKKKIEKISKKTGVACKILNIDESEENFNLAMRYYVSSTPTLIILKNNTVMDTIIGNVPEDRILESLRLYRCA